LLNVANVIDYSGNINNSDVFGQPGACPVSMRAGEETSLDSDGPFATWRKIASDSANARNVFANLILRSV
jgi:hypothetical protein